ncbi:prolyl 3-hydroxylase /prolyl 3,4-dihydroxylase [Nematocida sp. AWRm77]|nr:prolyl 3-hydroxylase /prolyl 3,4-dihydroxylase [Nematocida sp. AWRm77]
MSLCSRQDTESREEVCSSGRKEAYAPFYHRVVDNFLPKDLFDTVVKTYKETPFFRKTSDLFDFYQSNELKDVEEHGEFLKAVRREMGTDLGILGKETKNEQMDLFASCYFPKNYLLPHDDCLDGRVLAFSFYLNGEEGGEGEETKGGRLILYAEDGVTPCKKIAPIPNRLVIFEVSSVSYHEVEECFFTREALTGWLRSEGYALQSMHLPYERNKYWFFSKEEIISLDFTESLASIPLYKEEDLAKIRSVLGTLEWVPRLNRLYCNAEEPASNVGELGCTELPLELIPVDGMPVDSIVIKLEKKGYVLLNDLFNTRSSFLVVLSLFPGTIYLIDEAGAPKATITEEGMYGLGANVSIYVPPTEQAGYIIAYRMDKE